MITIFLTVGGAIFGFLLPKLICVSSELMLAKKVVLDMTFLKSFLHKLRDHQATQIPTTKTGKLIYSYPFLFSFDLIALYVVTSSAEWFGKAIVLGFGLRLMIDLWMSHRTLETFRVRWFSLFPAKLNSTELLIFVYGNLIFFGLLVLLALKA